MTEKRLRCPLCGGQLTASGLLDACSELADATLGVLAGICPFCQGKLEIRPQAGTIEIGYLAASRVPRFDAAKAFPAEGMTVEFLPESRELVVVLGERRRVFSATD